MPSASAQPLAARGWRSDLRRPPTGMLRAATRPPSLRRSGGRSGRRGACPHLAHVQSATWLLPGPTWCRVGRIWPGSSVAGSFGTQRSGVQISPTRLVREGLVTGPLAASEACRLTHRNRTHPASTNGGTPAGHRRAEPPVICDDRFAACQDHRGCRRAHSSRGRCCRRHGTAPSNSISSEKLRNVRTSTISPRLSALSTVGSIVIVMMMSAMMRTSSPSKMDRPTP